MVLIVMSLNIKKLLGEILTASPPEFCLVEERAGSNTRWNVGLLAAVIRGGMVIVFQSLHFIVMQLESA